VRAAERARQRGMAVVVTVLDRAWPAWLGQEAWQLPWTAAFVLEHARWLGRRLFCRGRVATVRSARRDHRRRLATGERTPWRRGAEAEARVAQELVASLRREVGDLSSWRGRHVDVLPEFPLPTQPGVMRGVIGASSAATVVVRSLVASAGPLGSREGLLEATVGGWRLRVSRELLNELR
jgi:hypothetical protein